MNLHIGGNINKLTTFLSVLFFLADLQADYTDAGRLIGHAVLGLEILRKTASSFQNIPQNTLLKLEHIILLNEDTDNIRALGNPQFPEAMFVNYINELDGKLNLMMDVIKNDLNLNWTSYQSNFKTKLLKK